MRNSELKLLPDIMDPLYEHGLDGVIVQDMGLLQYFGKRYQDVMNTSDLENMYCVPQLNHNISGSFNEKEYDFITIRLYPCINQSNATEICQDQDVIDSYLKGTIFTLEYQSFNFDPIIIMSQQNLLKEIFLQQLAQVIIKKYIYILKNLF